MKKRYWVMLVGAYAAAITGYFVYEFVQSRRSETEIIPAVYTAFQTVLTTSVSTTTAATSTAAATASTTAAAATASATTETTQTATVQTTRLTTTTTTATTTTTTSTATTTTTETTTTATTVSYPLNLNTATLEQLCTLPDIGEVLAQAIIDKRTRLGGFTNRKQLLEIPGIGESRYDEIRWLLYIDNEQPLTDAVTPAPASAVSTETLPAETAPLYINLNAASKDDLLRLPGCDETIAKHILWLRDEQLHGFHNPDELQLLGLLGEHDEHTVSGMGTLYEQWKPFLFVDDQGSKQLP